MKTIGRLTTLAAIAAVVVAVAVAVSSRPDVERYLKIRSM
jgi:hypothetical protein